MAKIEALKCAWCEKVQENNEYFTIDNYLFQCMQCGSINIIDTTLDTNFNVAHSEMKSYNFDRAKELYQQIANENKGKNDEAYALALKGQLFAEFGILYLKSSRENFSLATINRLPNNYDKINSIKEINKGYYYKEIKSLKIKQELKDNIFNEIEILDEQYRKIKYNLENKEENDVFICTKISSLDANQEYTEDSEVADKLYERLQQEGFKVFYSKKSKISGAHPDATIMSELIKSKQLVVIASKEEHLASPWVKSEWKRWMNFISVKKKKEDSLTFYFLDQSISTPVSTQVMYEFEELIETIKNNHLTEKIINDYYQKEINNINTKKSNKINYILFLTLILITALGIIIPNIFINNRTSSNPNVLNSDNNGSSQHSSSTSGGANKNSSKDEENNVVVELDDDTYHLSKEENGYKLLKVISNKNNIVIPEEINDIKIVALGEDILEDSTNVQTLVLPNNIIYIERGALTGCNNIEQLTLPFIGASINEQTNEYFGYIFGATSYGGNEDEVPALLKELTITKATSIADYAFYNCSNLQKINIANSVLEIGESAFEGCKEITSIILPDHIKVIENNTFSNCEKLSSINISSSVTRIGNYAFANCISLAEIELPNQLKLIGESAFINCSRIESMTLPFVGENADGSGATYLGYIFGATNYLGNRTSVPSSLKNIKITHGSTIKTNAFYGCESIENIEVSSDISTIEQSAFYGLNSLQSITLPFVGSSLDDSTAYFGKIFGATSAEEQHNYVPSTLLYVSITEDLDIIDKAFYGLSNINNITLSNNTNKIGNSAFYNCSSLIDFTIPSKVTSIGESSFYGCSSLTSIAIKDGITIIEESTFENCTSLNEVLLNNITNINKKAFKGCANLQEIELPNKLLSIEEHAFEGCCKLNEIFLPNNLTTIGFSSFKGCTNLNTLTLPFIGASSDGNGASHLGYIFGAEDYSYNSISIPSALKTVKITKTEIIQENAFKGCANIIDFYFTSNTKQIKNSVFSGCSSLENVYYAGNISDWCNIAFNNFESNPMNFATHCYMKNNDSYKEIIDIIIPENVTKLGNYQFSGFSEVTNVEIHNNVINIGINVFMNCNSIVNISIPFIGDSISGEYTNFGYLFNSDSNENKYIPSDLISVTITDGTIIPENSFASCEYIENIIIEGNITTIASSAFSNCVSLKQIEIPDSVQEIENNAFYNCSNLTNIKIPDNVIVLGENVLFGCNSLETITIPFAGETKNPSSDSNVHFSYIFGGDGIPLNNNVLIPESLKEVIITKSTTIAPWSFYNCYELTKIVVPNDLKNIADNAFAECRSLENITLPNGVTSIGNWAFAYCDKLQKLSFEPNSSLQSIGDYAFKGCDSLSTIILPEGLKIIGNCAFQICTKLSIIELPSTLTNIGESAFTDQEGDIIILYPKSVAKLYYKGTLEQWCNINFTNISSSPMYCSYNFYMLDENSEWYVVTSIEIPDTIISIGDFQFYGFKNVTSIEIPKSVTNIGSGAFYKCNSLKNVYYPGTIDDWCNITFDDEYANPMYYASQLYMLDENNEWYDATDLLN